jgi:hypothetical protein
MKQVKIVLMMFSFFISVIIWTGMTASSTFGGTVDLQRTGQVTCYDSSGNAMSCSVSGKDGEMQAGVPWPSPRFTDNRDGTVTDNLTGLMWLQDGNLFGPGSRMEWEDALFNVERLNANIIPNFGYNDWRIPNINELESLVNSEESDLATWLNSQGFTDVQSTVWYYWSSTIYATSGGNLAWALRMSDGEVQVLPISGTANGRNHFWAVRSGQQDNSDPTYPANIWKTGQTQSFALGDDGHLQMGVSWPSPRFTDTGDGTITDTLTGLVWLKDTSCIANQYPNFDNDWAPNDGGVTWQHALDFVAGINNGTFSNCGAGQTDWRLPNRKELYSLIDFSQFGPALPSGVPFSGNVGPTTFWSSTTSASSPDAAWNVDMWSGVVNAGLKSGGMGNYFFGVLPVRAGTVTPSGGGNGGDGGGTSDAGGGGNGTSDSGGGGNGTSDSGGDSGSGGGGCATSGPEKGSRGGFILLMGIFAVALLLMRQNIPR